MAIYNKQIGNKLVFFSDILGSCLPIVNYFDKSSKKHYNYSSLGVPVGYITISFRKNTKQFNQTTFDLCLERAKKLERAILESKASVPYGVLLQSAKNRVYNNRYSLEETGIHSHICLNYESITNPIQAINAMLCGIGFSAKTNKLLKPIVCLEKRKKVLTLFADKIADYFNIA
jgi:hypothetical protein